MALSTTRTLLTQTGINTHQVFNMGGINAVGVITATSFSGSGANLTDLPAGQLSGTLPAIDGSNLTGLPSGLGTALSSTQTSPLNKIYFTDKILSIGATVTIDPPPSSTVAYTNYSEIKISGADLIIKDGDDFIPDILGLSTTSLRGRYTYN